MKKIAGAAAATLLTVIALAGCGSSGDSKNISAAKPSSGSSPSGSSTPSGGDPSSSGDSGSGSFTTGNYCDDIKSASTRLAGLGANSFDGDNFAQIELVVAQVANEAPGNIKASWLELSTTFQAFQKALTDAGISTSDFSKLMSGKTPPKSEVAKLQKLEATLSTLDTKSMTAASNKISAEVQQDCGININKSGSS